MTGPRGHGARPLRVYDAAVRWRTGPDHDAHPHDLDRSPAIRAAGFAAPRPTLVVVRDRTDDVRDGDGMTHLMAAVRATFARCPDWYAEFLDGRGRPGERRSGPELLADWEARAGRLVTAGVVPGDLVFVCLPRSWDWLSVWFGAVIGGALPIAMAPPGSLGGGRHQLDVMDQVVARFDPRVVVASEALRKQATEFGLARLAARIRTPDEVDALACGDVPAIEPSPEDLAFLQLTSGSTGLPRAVAISHRAALATTSAIHRSVPYDDVDALPTGRSTIVTWLPLHHDMGLVGNLLLAVTQGHDIRFLPQRAFLGRPETWLQALAASPHTSSAAPNFAYQTCVERVPASKLEGVDLSRYRVALSGAEMIRADTMAAFADAFAPCGFRPEYLTASYGMAETTLTISIDRQRRGIRTAPVPDDARTADGPGEVVCCGEPVPGMEVTVRGPDGGDPGEGVVGDLMVRGDCLFSGYYRDEEATAEAFDGDWLRTGDLGFLLDGEVYVTGRRKEILILNGQNVMPHEIEWLAEETVGSGGACRAGAFPIVRDGPSEEPVVVVELDPNRTPPSAELARKVRQVVGRAIGAPLAEVVFVRRGGLPKTTSGKIQRGALRRRYLAGELERLEDAGASGGESA